MSISSFISYLQHEKKYSNHTLEAYENDLRSFQSYCSEQFDEESLEGVNHTYIRSWIVSLSKAGFSNRSINRKLSALKTYYLFLLKTGVIEVSPMAGQRALKVSGKVQVPFSEEEVETVISSLEGAADFEGVRDKLMIELLYSTGMRRAELIRLKLGDFDLAQQSVKVLGKRNKERNLPLLNSVMKSINTYLALRAEIRPETDHFFVTRSGKPVYPALVYRSVRGRFSLLSTKVKNSPHIIRHSFATHLLNKGADLNSVKDLLGHASLASTQVYTHNSIHELKQMYNLAHPRSKKNH